MFTIPKITTNCEWLLNLEVWSALLINITAVAVLCLGAYLMYKRGKISLKIIEEGAHKDPATMSDAQGKRVSPGQAKGILDSLKALAETLSKTPAGLTLMIIGVALFALPSVNVGAPCEAVLQGQANAVVGEKLMEKLLATHPISVTTTKSAGKVETKVVWKEAKS